MGIRYIFILKKIIPYIQVGQLLTQYKTPILYSGGSIAKAFAQMAVGFVIAKFISPNDFGLWTSINLAVTYSVFFQAGLINGLNLELPLAYGSGNKKKQDLWQVWYNHLQLYLQP